jgi:oxygen-independent coproporphyrinogen-3 oxidase
MMGQHGLSVKESLRERLLRDLAGDPGILILAYPYARTWHPISRAAVQESWALVNQDEAGTLYIHFPFCRRKCAFCDFLAYYGRPEAEIDAYLGLVRHEIRLVAKVAGHVTIEAVQFGGGTPSLLSPEQVSALMEGIPSGFGLSPSAEVSMEVFPDSEVTKEQLGGWRKAGVNRLSFGIQTFDDQLKHALGRTDWASDNLKLVRQGADLGWDNVNIDLMCGVPNQSMESWSATLQLTVDLRPAHVCVFPVSVRHPGTGLFDERGSLPPPNQTRQMYDTAASFLREAGYSRTTRHDFVRPGFEYRYERMIAELAPLVGLGGNSISYSRDCIYRNYSDLPRYASAIRGGELPLRAGHVFPDDEKPHNWAVRNIEYLRLSGRDFRARFGMSLQEAFGPQIELLGEVGLASVVNGDLVLSDDGVYFTSSVKRLLFHPSAWERFDSMKPEEFVIEREALAP